MTQGRARIYTQDAAQKFLINNFFLQTSSSQIITQINNLI